MSFKLIRNGLIPENDAVVCLGRMGRLYNLFSCQLYQRGQYAQAIRFLTDGYQVNELASKLSGSNTVVQGSWKNITAELNKYMQQVSETFGSRHSDYLKVGAVSYTLLHN